jgi:enoyl-[acyl-carrier protein] reductase II
MIKTNITEMLGIKVPIVSAPMGPFRTSDLCVAVSENGGLGVLSHTGFTPSGGNIGSDVVEAMKVNMQYVVEHTDKPFGFNVRTSRNEPAAPILCNKIPTFIKENTKIKDQCVYALTSAGSAKTLPKSQTYQDLKASGSQIKQFHVAPALWLAGKCKDAGVDGVVATGSEGGGHQSFEKVSTLVLLQQIKNKYPDLPVIACGGFVTGDSLAAALSLGAGAVAMGSRFIASKDSEFNDVYKNVVPPAHAQDTLIVTGVLGPIRLWKNDYSLHHDAVSSKEELLAQEAKAQAMTPEQIMEALGKTARAYIAAYEGDIKSGAVLLGQSIGIIEQIESVKDIMENIVKDAEAAIRKSSSYLI